MFDKLEIYVDKLLEYGYSIEQLSNGWFELSRIADILPKDYMEYSDILHHNIKLTARDR